MSDLSSSRRWVAEIRFGEQQEVAFRIGNRSIHQFWHLFSSQFRNVLLPPQRRPDGGTVRWSWRDGVGDQPVGAAELADVRRQLTAANRVWAGNGAGPAEKETDADAPDLETQLRTTVSEMVARLIAESDQALAGFVCRTESGPMIHSWGAASPAVPFRPDAQNGDIIGNVLVDAKGLAGVAVVIENSQGAIVARTESDQVGYFRFHSVAPGSYRIKVVGRPDFPAGGLAMTMTRESVTGLEIRGGTSNRTTTASPPVPAETASPQSRRRRPLAWLALVAVLIAGIGVWWFRDRPVDPKKKNGRPEVWQSATAQVAGGTPATSATAGGVSGADREFSSLSAGMPPFGIPGTASGKSVASERGDRSRDAIRSVDSTAIAPSFPAGAPSIDPIHRPAIPAMRESRAGMQPTGSATAAVHGPREDQPSDKAPAASAEPGENSDESPADEDDKAPAGAAKSRAAAKKPHSSPTGIPSTGRETSPGQSASGEGPSSPGRTDFAAKANEKKMAKPKSTTKRRAGATSGPAGPEEESSDAADSSDTEDSGTIADRPEHKSTGQRARRTAPAGNASTGQTAAVPNDQAVSETASASSVNADAPGSGTSPIRSKLPKKAAKRAVGASTRSSSPSDVAPSDNPETEAVATAAAASASAGARPAAASSVAGSKPASASNSNSPSADQSPPDEASAAATETPVPAAGTKAPARSKPARTNRAKNKHDPNAADEGPDDPPPDSASPASQPPNTVPISAAGDDGLVQRRQIGASTWKSQLVRDLILPTVPIRANENETVDSLRAEMLKQQAERRPKSFRAPRTTGSFVLEFAVDGAEGNERPHWRDASGAEPLGAVVHGNRAEVSWTGPLPAQAMNYSLAYPDGREIARLKGAPNQVPVLSTAVDVRSWFRVGVECAAGESAAQFDWRLRSGAPVPAGWSQHDDWLGGRGPRLDLPLDTTAAGPANYALTLVDRSTGWALTCDLTVR